MRVRSQPVTCVGSGILLRAVTVALAELGFGRVNVLAAGDDSTLQDLVEGVTREDERAEWNLDLHPATTPLHELLNATTAPGILLATESTDYEAIAAAIENRSGDSVVGIVAAAGDLVVASPLMTNEEWCWECLYRSLVTDRSVSPAPASASLAAFQAVQRLFCRFAGPPVPENRYFTTVDCRTLTVQAHQPRRHEACMKHGAVVLDPIAFDAVGIEQAPIRPDIPTSHDADELTAVQDRIVESLSELTDRVTGPFLSVGEEDLTQLPLAASLCRIRGPNNLPGSTEIKTFECRALAPREARNQVVLLALEWLAGVIVERRGKHEALPAIGAGWSQGEAIYRAWAAASIRSLQSSAVSARHEAVQLPASPARTFLLDTLAQHARGPVEVQVNALSTGLIGASVVANGETLGQGVGIDELNASDHALADAVARRSVPPAGDFLGTAYMAPSLDSWREILTRINDRATEHYAVFQFMGLLPFLDGRAWIVGLEEATTPKGGAAE